MNVITVPTRGRVERQLTLKNLPKQLHPVTFLYCPKEEVKEHQARWPDVNVVAQPKSITTIAEKRAWIIKRFQENDRVVMLDDDLDFYRRCDESYRVYDEAAGFWKIKPEHAGQVKLGAKSNATPADIRRAFVNWFKLLERWAHGGMSSRLGNHYEPSELTHTTRQMHAMGFVAGVWKTYVKPNRINLKEDFDYNLQLLRRGYDNFLIYDTFVAPGAYGEAGGCTDERVLAGHDASAIRLQELHPELVTVVDKNYQGVPRKEVRVKWKLALGFDRKDYDATKYRLQAGGRQVLRDGVEK